jgi:hypothetical protein
MANQQAVMVRVMHVLSAGTALSLRILHEGNASVEDAVLSSQIIVSIRAPNGGLSALRKVMRVVVLVPL